MSSEKKIHQTTYQLTTQGDMISYREARFQGTEYDFSSEPIRQRKINEKKLDEILEKICEIMGILYRENETKKTEIKTKLLAGEKYGYPAGWIKLQRLEGGVRKRCKPFYGFLV